MSTSPTVPSEYDPNLFVDREEDVNRVVDLVRALAAGRTVPRRTVIFRGERGCGKTWLLRHLAEDAYAPDDSPPYLAGGQLAEDPKVKSWYMSLAAFSGVTPEENVKAIINALRKQIGEWRGVALPFANVDNLSLYELSSLVFGAVEEVLQKNVLVLVFDHVYESSSELLEVLEVRLLAPLARQTRMLIVMAGRGRGYAWRAPELRLRADEYWLQGLGVAATEQPAPPSLMQEADVVRPKQIEATREQLRRLKRDPEQTEEILRKTHGHPLSNRLLALGKSNGDIVAEMLGGVFQQQDERHHGRQLLELVCVLRFFDEPQISGLLAACRDGNDFPDIAGMQPREIIGTLLQTNLVRYDTMLGAYVMDEVVRRPLEGNLEEQRSDFWRRLHEVAWDMYCRWLKEYPQAEARLKPEAEYHAMRLGMFDRATSACPELQAHEES